MSNLKDRIAIFEDNNNILKSITRILEAEGYTIVGKYVSGDKLFEKLISCEPSIVILDIQMPGLSGVELIPKIKSFNRQIKILMQTVFEDEEKISQTILAGADGYLLKSELFEKLTDTIERIKIGENPISPKVANVVFQMLAKGKIAVPQALEKRTQYNFTQRERQILNEMISGKSYKQISDELIISYETVHSHIKNIYKKLEVSSMTEAVSKALQEGIL
jgi:DNA-binding NarL/FixJ family response regulator